MVKSCLLLWYICLYDVLNYSKLLVAPPTENKHRTLFVNRSVFYYSSVGKHKHRASSSGHLFILHMYFLLASVLLYDKLCVSQRKLSLVVDLIQGVNYEDADFYFYTHVRFYEDVDVKGNIASSRFHKNTLRHINKILRRVAHSTVWKSLMLSGSSFSHRTGQFS